MRVPEWVTDFDVVDSGTGEGVVIHQEADNALAAKEPVAGPPILEKAMPLRGEETRRLHREGSWRIPFTIPEGDARTLVQRAILYAGLHNTPSLVGSRETACSWWNRIQCLEVLLNDSKLRRFKDTEAGQGGFPCTIRHQTASFIVGVRNCGGGGRIRRETD